MNFTYSKYNKIIVTNQPTLDFHNLLLNILSIGVLINGEKKDFKLLQKFIESYSIQYKLFDVFINFKIKEHSIQESNYSLKQYKKLEVLIEPITFEKKNIITYHKKWFQSLSPTYFNISSTMTNGMFDGYWCFESAALAKVFSFDIEELFDNVYFPTDLFNNDDTFFEYKITLEHNLLNSIDKTMRDIGKNWGIRNSSNEILIARRILQRYNKKRYKELELQIKGYFDYIENSKLTINKEKILINKPFVINNLIKLLKNYEIEYSILEIRTDKNSIKTDATFWGKLKNIWT